MPFGDQGIFLRKEVFLSSGGFSEVPIAEDLLFVRHLRAWGGIRTMPEPVTTSARRWSRLGVIRNTLINQIILAGCLLGVAPEKLAHLYRLPR